MNTLRIKYDELCATEAIISIELSKARQHFMKPTEEVLQWLQDVEGVRNQVDFIERSLEQRSARSSSGCFSSSTGCFSCNSHQKIFGLVREVIKLIDRLQENSNFPNGLVVSDRSNLWPAPTLVGISALRTLDKIWANLMDPAVGVIGICGLGGVGKTTIMMNIKNQLATVDHFDKVFWITVSKEFNLREVQNEMALQLNLDLRRFDHCDQDHQVDAARLLDSLNKVKKFLVIFDDVWHQVVFEKVGIPQPNADNGCKIVLITRSLDICRRMRSDKIVRVEVLSPNEAWDLFVSKAGTIVLTRDIQPFARRVVQKCCRVPIIIISVGLAMRDEISIKVWRKALVALSTPAAESHDIVLELLRYSYDRLGDTRVQKCFLYCAFFPEDYLFKSDELVRYWIAEGFVEEEEEEDGDIITKTDYGLEIVRMLVDANMLETFTKGGDDCLIMHDLFRDLAIRIMKGEPGVCVKAGLGLQGLPSDKEWVEARKISLMRNQIKTLELLPTNFPNLSTLLLHYNPISHIFPTFFNQLHSLEFLDLSYSSITELPASLSELCQLRVMFLHYCVSLKTIPSLQQMKHLQVLSLCGTAITKLPLGMEGLISLKSLDISETTKLETIEAGVLSSLFCLEELRMQGSGLCKMDSIAVANYLMEMRGLKRLAVLAISIVCSEDLLDTIMCLQEQKLKVYFINVYGSTEDYIEEDEETM